MAQTAVQFATNIQQFADSLSIAVDKILLTVSEDLRSEIQSRVQEDATNAQGGRFSPYAKSTLKQKQKRGASTNKNFEDTSQMWSGFGVKRRTRTNYTSDVVLGGTTAYSQNLIDLNSKREGISDERGGIIEPSAAEILQLNKDFEEALINEIKAFFK